MLRRILKSIISLAILSFFGNAGLQIFKDGFYGFSITVFLFGLFSAMMAYFSIEGREVKDE